MQEKSLSNVKTTKSTLKNMFIKQQQIINIFMKTCHCQSVERKAETRCNRHFADIHWIVSANFAGQRVWFVLVFTGYLNIVRVCYVREKKLFFLIHSHPFPFDLLQIGKKIFQVVDSTISICHSLCTSCLLRDAKSLWFNCSLPRIPSNWQQQFS